MVVAVNMTPVERRLTEADPGLRMSAFDLDGWVDPETWQRAVALIEQAATLLHEGNRPPRTAGTLHISATATAFARSVGPNPSETR